MNLSSEDIRYMVLKYKENYGTCLSNDEYEQGINEGVSMILDELLNLANTMDKTDRETLKIIYKLLERG